MTYVIVHQLSYSTHLSESKPILTHGILYPIHPYLEATALDKLESKYALDGFINFFLDLIFKFVLPSIQAVLI